MERDFKDERADAGKTRRVEIQICIFKTERKEVNRRGRKESKITEVWTPYVANRLQIPPLEETLIRRGKKVLLQRSPEGGIGLVDVHRKTTRIKQFRLSEAIVHSYFTDIRFVTLVCLLIGFSAWWVIAPEQLFESPKYAFSGEVAQLVRDTFIENICRIA